MAYNLYTNVQAKDISNSGKRSLDTIRNTVFHYTGNSTDKARNNAIFYRDSNTRKAGAHFFVDKDDVYMSIPLDLIANAVGGSKYSDCSSTGGGKYYKKVTNKNSWSIEMCSTHGAFDKETLQNAAILYAAMCKKWKIPTQNVFRHFDVNGKHCPAYWIGNDAWGKFKGLLISIYKNFVPNGLQNFKDVDGNWYYLNDLGEKTNYTGLAENNNGWFYINNGKVDFSYTGLYNDSKYGWWYIQKGTVQKGYTGLVQNSKGWWLVDNGKIRFNYNGLYHDKTYGWWYLKDSFVDKSFTGFVENNQGWWYVDCGKIDFKHNGLYNDPKYGWWYVKDSKIDKSYTNLEKYNDVWWYVQKGHITFDYKGLATNQYGTWYLDKSKVDFSYNGKYTDSNGKIYNVVKGKVS